MLCAVLTIRAWLVPASSPSPDAKRARSNAHSARNFFHCFVHFAKLLLLLLQRRWWQRFYSVAAWMGPLFSAAALVRDAILKAHIFHSNCGEASIVMARRTVDFGVALNKLLYLAGLHRGARSHNVVEGLNGNTVRMF